MQDSLKFKNEKQNSHIYYDTIYIVATRGISKLQAQFQNLTNKYAHESKNAQLRIYKLCKTHTFWSRNVFTYHKTCCFCSFVNNTNQIFLIRHFIISQKNQPDIQYSAIYFMKANVFVSILFLMQCFQCDFDASTVKSMTNYNALK